MSKNKKIKICITREQLEHLYNEVIDIEGEQLDVENIFISKDVDKIEVAITYLHTEYDVKEITL
jgi:hypothetical protein